MASGPVGVARCFRPATWKTLGGGFNPAEGSLWRHRGELSQIVSVAPAELVVHADLEDVVPDLHVLADKCRVQGAVGARAEEALGPDVHIEEFTLDRPAVAEHVFRPEASLPAAKRLRRNGSAGR